MILTVVKQEWVEADVIITEDKSIKYRLYSMFGYDLGCPSPKREDKFKKEVDGFASVIECRDAAVKAVAEQLASDKYMEEVMGR